MNVPCLSAAISPPPDGWRARLYLFRGRASVDFTFMSVLSVLLAWIERNVLSSASERSRRGGRTSAGSVPVSHRTGLLFPLEV